MNVVIWRKKVYLMLHYFSNLRTLIVWWNHVPDRGLLIEKGQGINQGWFGLDMNQKPNFITIFFQNIIIVSKNSIIYH